jgi:hypothetical protein
MVPTEDSRPFPLSPRPLTPDGSRPAAERRATPPHAADQVEAKPAVAPQDLWAGLAVDANELLGRMHSGQGWDPQHVIQRALAERRAA